jgi:hypothetical protein
VITNSQMKAFRRCAREHQYSYTLGYRPAERAEALRFGTLLHLGLEAWWKAPEGERLAHALAALDDGESDAYERARAAAMLRGYDARWCDEPYDVLAVEAEFYTALVNPETGAPSRTYGLGGKIDVLVSDRRDGLARLVEHKTSSEDISAGSDYWKRLLIDPQVSTYFAGGRALGHDIAECVYDVLGKPGQRPSAVALRDADNSKIVLDAGGERVRTKDGKKWRETGDAALGYVLQTRPETPDEYHDRVLAAIAENPERYYQRGTVVRLEAEEADAAHDAWHTARLIREAELASRWPRNPDACVRYGRTCEFFGVCTGTATLDSQAFRRTENPHEELTTEAA